MARWLAGRWLLLVPTARAAATPGGWPWALPATFAVQEVELDGGAVRSQVTTSYRLVARDGGLALRVGPARVDACHADRGECALLAAVVGATKPWTVQTEIDAGFRAIGARGLERAAKALRKAVAAAPIAELVRAGVEASLQDPAFEGTLVADLQREWTLWLALWALHDAPAEGSEVLWPQGDGALTIRLQPLGEGDAPDTRRVRALVTWDGAALSAEIAAARALLRASVTAEALGLDAAGYEAMIEATGVERRESIEATLGPDRRPLRLVIESSSRVTTPLTELPAATTSRALTFAW